MVADDGAIPAQTNDVVEAKLKQSEDEIARLKAELNSFKSKEGEFAEQSAKLTSQLADTQRKAAAAAAEAEQARKAKEAAEKELSSKLADSQKKAEASAKEAEQAKAAKESAERELAQCNCHPNLWNSSFVGSPVTWIIMMLQ